MTPTLTKHPRCETHRHALLTSEGECPTCTREAQRAAQSDADEAKEQRKLQAMTRAQRPTEGDKRRRMTGAEAERIAGGVL